MAVSQALKSFLTAKRVKFDVRKHPVVYTAQEIAAAQHVPGAQLAKCVLVAAGKELWLAVLPATHLINLAKLKRLLKVSRLALASEAQIRRAFPDVEVGAMSPFGNLYQVPVIVDHALAQCAEIVCNAGTHAETLAVAYRDFEELVKPRVGDFGLRVAPKAVAKRKAAARTTPRRLRKPPARPLRRQSTRARSSKR